MLNEHPQIDLTINNHTYLSEAVGTSLGIWREELNFPKSNFQKRVCARSWRSEGTCLCRWVDGVRTEERKAQREEMGIELGVRTEVCINFQKRERGARDGKGTERVSA